jgi:hypothetical protein
MSLRSEFEGDLLAAFQDLAVPATYRPKAGSEIATYALVENRQIEVEARVRGEFSEIRIPIRDVPDPTTDDSVEVDGTTWHVRPSTALSILRRESWPFWIIFCRRDVRPTLSGGGK